MFLIWDFDGTLAYREAKWSGTLTEVVRRERPDLRVGVEQFRPYMQTGFPWHQPDRPHNLSSSPETWWESMVPRFQAAFEGVAGLQPKEAERLARCVREAYIDPVRWEVYSDTIPSLKDLADRGWEHVVLSNHVPELHSIIDALSLSAYISRVFNSAETGLEKPNAAAFRNVLSSLPAGATAWMIGDNPIADVAGAHGVGLPAILVRTEKPMQGAIRYHSKTLSGVADLLIGP